MPAVPGAQERGALTSQGWTGAIDAAGDGLAQVLGEGRLSVLTAIALTMLSNQTQAALARCFPHELHGEALHFVTM